MRVRDLYVYPVKGCRAIALEHATFGVLGIEGDRRFSFVDPEGRAVTQRDEPLLATITPALRAEELCLDLGGLAELRIEPRHFCESVIVDVWGKRIPGRAVPAPRVAAAADYLGMRVRLVALDRAAERSFADSRPVLVATTAMLASLNAELSEPVGMERFRPNVVLEGDEPWTSLEGEDVLLERDKACGRCEVTTIDQASGARRGPEPLFTLNERFGGNFGAYCRVARAGALARGEVLQAS